MQGDEQTDTQADEQRDIWYKQTTSWSCDTRVSFYTQGFYRTPCIMGKGRNTRVWQPLAGMGEMGSHERFSYL